MDRINVTKSFLPPLEDYQEYLSKIWENTQLTNQGPLLLQFEDEVKKYLGINDFHFVANGTVALQIALRALNITGSEVITTPFSYVATTSAILWEHCKPVYVDIEPKTFCIDTNKIEQAITPRTKAILAVHVFGHPCNIEAIDKIAKKHKLKVIYDAAHAFGVKYKGKSLLSYGDITTCSFHATKLFHTIEGGALIAKDKRVSDKIELIKRFGHSGDDHYVLGINAKVSETHAAMGLCNLKYIDELIEKRKAIHALYNKLLGNSFKRPVVQKNTVHNYGYYPIILKSEELLHKVVSALNLENIFPRRYFYPSLNTLPYIQDSQSCPISENISRRVLCLPMYADLEEANVKRISTAVQSA